MSKNNSPDQDNHGSGHDDHAEVPKDAIAVDSLQDKFLILAGVGCLAGLLFVIVQWGGIQLPEVREGGESAQTQTAPNSSEGTLKTIEAPKSTEAPTPTEAPAGVKSSELTPLTPGQTGIEAPTAPASTASPTSSLAPTTTVPSGSENQPPATTAGATPVASPPADPNAAPVSAPGSPPTAGSPNAPQQNESAH